MHNMENSLVRKNLRRIVRWSEEGSAQSSEEGTLYFTENADTARKLAAAGYPVLGILTSENEGDDFSGVSYLAEKEALKDETYLEQIYCRMTGRPYTVLETARCILRESTEEDVDAFYQIYREPGMTRYMEALFPEREKEVAYIRDYRKYVYGFYGFGIWTVLYKETGEIIGRIGIEINTCSDVPQLGYVLAKDFQGKGIAKEVVKEVLRYGFEELDFKRIEARTHGDNEASLRLLQKLGFVYRKTVDGLLVYETGRKESANQTPNHG